MHGVMWRVSAYLPALMRMCLFDWKAVRSHYAMGAKSVDDQNSAGVGGGGCLGVRISCHIEPYRRSWRTGRCAKRENGADIENNPNLFLTIFLYKLYSLIET